MLCPGFIPGPSPRWTQLRVQTQLQEEGLTRANIVALLAKQPGLVVDKAGKPVDVAAALAGKVWVPSSRLSSQTPCRQSLNSKKGSRAGKLPHTHASVLLCWRFPYVRGMHAVVCLSSVSLFHNVRVLFGFALVALFSSLDDKWISALPDTSCHDC